ncbi:holo-ACP synthase, partial [Undibacterium sp. CCC3.4]|uniref:holo-ACP synthase n=1 Tax=Undibacterium sp. CCC3.4 TaxID=3048609 RepID=UPI002B23EAA5
MESSVKRHGDRFAEKILGVDELTIYHQRKASTEVRGLQFLATRFAAKEAFSKAIGLGITEPMNWSSVQILNLSSGQPI